MDWAWQQLQREWTVIRQMPLLSGIVWMLGLVVIWFLADKQYRNRLTARDDLLRMYQEKLGLGPHKKRPYSKRKNQELRKTALDLAQNIRAFTALADSQAKASENFAKFLPYVASQYTNNFKVESVLLRDEIMLRLPKAAREDYRKSDPRGMVAFAYQNPVNTDSMGMVADDLDKLARMLPS